MNWEMWFLGGLLCVALFGANVALLLFIPEATSWINVFGAASSFGGAGISFWVAYQEWTDR